MLDLRGYVFPQRKKACFICVLNGNHTSFILNVSQRVLDLYTALDSSVQMQKHHTYGLQHISLSFGIY